MKDLLEFIAKNIVTQPNCVQVTEIINGETIKLRLKVAPEDMSKVIGKHGKTANAIRYVVKASSTSSTKRVTVEII